MAIAHRLLDDPPVVDLRDASARRGAGDALRAARELPPDALIDLVEASGLRGRGGAGFPVGRKWRSIAAAAPTPAPIVVNAAEGEPGTFKDRLLLRSNPYLVLEGACLAAHAMGTDRIVVALKASFERELARLGAAIAEIEEAGWVPPGTITTAVGPGEYLFGEDTALLEVLAGRPPFPRVVPSYRRGIETDAGEPATPAMVNNVETLANVPGIVTHGADWFRSVGTSASPGTLLCTVTGATARHGVAEFEMGTPLREVIEDIGVGVPDIGVVLGGVSSPPLTADLLDTPLTYEDFAAVGSGLGSASFIVIDRDTSVRDVAAGVARYLAVESCGQCEPCKHDGLAIVDGFREGDDAQVARRLGTVARGARCALAGQIERVVGRLVELAGERDTGRPVTPYPILPLVDIVEGRALLDRSHLSKRPDWSYEGEESDSHVDPRQRYADAPVRIRRPHLAEPHQPAGTASPAAPAREQELFGALHRSHTRIEALLASLRAAEPSARSAVVERLRTELERHRSAVERFVFPLVEQLDPVTGPDVEWYPHEHDREARRLLDRMADTGAAADPRLVDELCADVHVSIVELDRRILPEIDGLLHDEHRRRLVDDDIRAALEGERSAV